MKKMIPNTGLHHSHFTNLFPTSQVTSHKLMTANFLKVYKFDPNIPGLFFLRCIQKSQTDGKCIHFINL